MNQNTGGWASRAALSIITRLFSTGTNASRPVVAILPPEDRETILQANLDAALIARGFGATIAQVPDGTTTGGNQRGQRATDFQKERGVASQVASGSGAGILAGQSNRASGFYSSVVGGASNTASSDYSFVGGGQSNTASSNWSFVGGGQNNTASSSNYATACGGNGNIASGQYAFVGAGQSNTASSTRSAVVGGVSNTASNVSAIVCGGDSNTADATRSAICGGYGNTANATTSTVCGGQNNSANGISSFIGGGRRGTARSIAGYHVFPACDIPIADNNGVTQSALLLLGRQTTDATATVLTSNTSAASTNNQVTLPNNSAYSFSGEVIAGVTGAGNSARWTINGAIKRGANAGSTVMIGTPTVTMTHFDAGAATWVVSVTADTTNGAITVTVTGAASTTIRWTCKINTTEMTF